jgi:hypothetical protein
MNRGNWGGFLDAKSSEDGVGVQKAELNGNVDSESNHGGCSRGRLRSRLEPLRNRDGVHAASCIVSR